jgi:hypothetical protein
VPANEVPGGAGEAKADDPPSPSNADKPEQKSEPPVQTAAPAPQTPDTKTSDTKTAQPKPEPKAAMSKAAEQKPQPPVEQKSPQPQPTETAAQPQIAAPTPAGSQATLEDLNRVSAMLGLPFNYDTTSGAKAERMEKFTEGVRELKAQVKKCLKLPPGVAPNQRVRTVVQVKLTRNGALEGADAIEYATSALGPKMMEGALRAVRQCAPYNLPADKYEDWRDLQIDFSPDQMMGSEVR